MGGVRVKYDRDTYSVRILEWLWSKESYNERYWVKLPCCNQIEQSENANDYQRETQCDTKTTNGKYFGYLANGVSYELK